MTLKDKFWSVLVGFEKYNFTEEQIAAYACDFETATFDYNACTVCNGELCRTTINRNCIDPLSHYAKGGKCSDKCFSPENNIHQYYALSHSGCLAYGRPAFAIHGCPGPEAKKGKMLEIMGTGKRVLGGAYQND